MQRCESRGLPSLVKSTEANGLAGEFRHGCILKSTEMHHRKQDFSRKKDRKGLKRCPRGSCPLPDVRTHTQCMRLHTRTNARRRRIPPGSSQRHGDEEIIVQNRIQTVKKQSPDGRTIIVNSGIRNSPDRDSSDRSEFGIKRSSYGDSSHVYELRVSREYDDLRITAVPNSDD